MPFGELLPRARAIVHHGGIGTAARALKAGIPQLVLPRAYDQFDNAQRLERLGVAAVLSQSAQTATAMARALARLLASESVATRCRECAQRLQESAAVERGCDLIEALLPG
jgi:rhamnosyltransferase subunit B